MKSIWFVQANNVYGNDRRSVYIPYASGCIATYAFSDEKIKAECVLGGIVFTHEPIKQAASRMNNPFLVAFSCSVWNYEYNKALAAEIKRIYPNTVIVFGGHNVYPDFRTLEECPETDYLIYREGEEPFRKLVRCLLEGGNPAYVENIAFRGKDGYVRTEEKSYCITDYPSPYLNGIFDGITDKKTNFSAILETNRGCPFRCAFCDWGSLKGQVRAFPTERVKAEIDWIASHGIEYVYCADGNFGIFDRDEEIAEYIISSKLSTGFPKSFRVCFTKNRTGFAKNICKKFNEYGLDKAQTISFQSLSPDVLKNIGRKNISLEHFRELMNEYNRCGISTSSELILGLPGETKESFVCGICDLLEYGQHKAIQVYTCDLLPNSEMGSPGFIEKHGIETVRTPFYQAHCNADENHEVREYNTTVIRTNTMSVEDWIYCVVFACIVQAFHNIGFFRTVAMYLRNTKGTTYKDIYSSIAEFSSNPENKACNAVYSLVKELATGMSQGRNAWVAACASLGDILWQFDEIYFLKSLENADEIYNELEKNICKKYGEDEEIRAVFDFQRKTLKRVGKSGEIRIESDYDFYGYLNGIYEGNTSPLKKEKTVITVKDNQKYETLYDYACSIVWYGRNQAAALYTSDCWQPSKTVRED